MKQALVVTPFFKDIELFVIPVAAIHSTNGPFSIFYAFFKVYCVFAEQKS